MPEQEAPKVALRRPGDGDSINLPMGGLQAHITRIAARTETGGHWAIGEAWQDPGFDNPPHTHDEAEAFYVLEGSYTFYTDSDPAEGIGPGTFVFIPPGAVHGFRTGPEGGRLFCIWPSSVETAFFGGSTLEAADEWSCGRQVAPRRAHALMVDWRTDSGAGAWVWFVCVERCPAGGIPDPTGQRRAIHDP